MNVYVIVHNDYVTVKAARSFAHACRLAGVNPDDPEVVNRRTIPIHDLWERDDK